MSESIHIPTAASGNVSDDHASGPYDDLLRQVTRPLRGDPELQREIRLELLGHLEDAAAENHRAGMADAEAAEQARARLGDAREISNLLFQAHRRRLLIRRIVKWTLGLALIPTVVVIVIAVGWSSILSEAVRIRPSYRVREDERPLMRLADRLSQAAFTKQVAGLKPDERLIVDAVFSWPPQPRPADRAAAAQRLLDRWPTNPIYFAYSAVADFNAQIDRVHGGIGGQSHGVTALLAKLDRGQQLEPDNALYNTLRAVVLFRLRAGYIEVKPQTLMVPGEKPFAALPRLNRLWIEDRNTIHPALVELQHGWTKPYLKDYWDDLEREGMRLLPHPANLAEEMQRLYSSSSFNRGPMEAAELSAAYAAQLAADHRVAPDTREIEKYLDGSMRIGRLLDESNIIYRQSGLSSALIWYRVDAMRSLGRLQAADAARDEYIASELEHRKQWERIRDAERPHPMETAAQFAAGRLVLAVLLALLTVVAMRFFAIVTAGKLRDAIILQVLRPDNDDRPLRFTFIGWHRLAWIALCAVVIPIGLFIAWSRVHIPWRNSVIGYQVAENCLMIAGVISLLWHLARRAVRDRAAELGIKAPPAVRWRSAILGLGVIALSLFAGWVLQILVVHRMNMAPSDAEIPTIAEIQMPILARLVWLACALPLLWLAVSVAGRWGGTRRRRMCLLAAFICILFPLLSEKLSERIVAFSFATGIPLMTFYLVGASFIVAPIVFRLLTILKVVEPSNRAEHAEFAPFHRLWAGSILPVFGGAIVLLGLIAGWPLQLLEARAARNLDTALTARLDKPSP